MVFEHFALNVRDIGQVVDWYCQNLHLTIVSEQKTAPYMTFLADSTGRVVLELYSREDADIRNFESEHPLTFHVAFVSEDAKKDRNRLVAQGASLFEEVHKPDGSHLVMLRDPWGMPLQLCQRYQKF
ncbi:VOC family protein [Maribacter litopenaei]|uniref:VOC family protein n=1 Tax=Maribacter litopenaei TaxID=2976127 RepID=A0ABY5YAG9_9FLAO|nr:VOC family protein [Maribacter litopenaei]UWX55322.1 VOC family protein [Maribacter litopenaei]